MVVALVGCLCEAYREYVKTHHKVHRLEECFAPLQGLLKLLRHVHIPIAVSLTQVWLRTCFWHNSQEVGSIRDAVQDMLDEGLLEHVQEVDADQVKKIELWLRVMVHDTIASHMAMSSEEESQELLPVLAGDTTQLSALLEGIEDSTAHECLRPVGEDALAFSVVLKVMSQESVDIRALKDASDRLKSPRMKTVQQSFSKGSSGPEVLSKAAELLQMSGKDEAADAKLKLALERLQDEKVPRLVVTAESPTFTSLESIHDMSAVAFLDEIVSDVSEAMANWSPLQRELQAAQVQIVVTSLLDVVSVISEALVYDMTGIVMSTKAHDLISDGPMDASSWDQARAQVAFQELDSRLAMYMVEDAPFQAFLQRLTNWLKNLPASVFGDALSCQLPEDVVCKAIDNCTACAKVDGVLRSMARLLDSEHLGAQDLVDEFTKQTDPVLQAATRLPLAAQLRKDMDALEDVSFQLAESCAPVQLSMDFGEGVEVFAICAAVPADLPRQLSRMVVRDLIGDLVSEAIAIILQSIAQGVSLCKVRAPRAIPHGMAMPQQLALFVDATAETARPVAAWLKQKRVEAPWATDATVALAKQLLLTLHDKGQVVGVSPLCRPAASAEGSSTEDLAALQTTLDVISVVGKVSSLFAWVRASCLGHRPGSMAVDSMVHADLELAVSTVLALLRVADGLIEQNIDAQLAPVRDLDWLFPVGQFTAWKVLAKMVAEALARVAISSCVKSMAQASEVLLKVVPTWTHLVDGANFNVKLADRHLVRWSSKTKMNEGALRLEKALKSVARVFTHWGFHGPVEEDAEYAADFGSIGSVYKGAKQVLTLTAIVNLLVNAPPSKERAEKAKCLADASAEWLPRGLVLAVERLK